MPNRKGLPKTPKPTTVIKTEPTAPELEMLRNLKALAHHPSTDEGTRDNAKAKLEGWQTLGARAVADQQVVLAKQTGRSRPFQSAGVQLTRLARHSLRTGLNRSDSSLNKPTWFSAARDRAVGSKNEI